MERERQTLTFLFTDIEGSTARWAEQPDAMRAALAAHDATLRAAVAEHGGKIFKHTGDGIVAVFPAATGAVAAALEAQQCLELPVRMGLHSGEADERDGDWFGPTLNRAARIMDAGHGGQALCSTATAELIGSDVGTVALGEYRLKGIDRPERIIQLGTGTHPPLRVAPVTAELPEPRTHLLGRADLVAEIAGLLTDHRLVTLVGPGGVGKTAVAIEAAHRYAPFVDRAVFVDLSVVDAGDDILAAVVQSLGVSAVAMPAVQMALAGSTSLVVFDNCEHLIDAAADIADELLESVPDLRVLATSREHLELNGERVVTVPPLVDDDVLAQLFVDRVAALSSATPGPIERDRVVELCHRLDGLPLAIELAAARSTVLSVDQMLERIDDRFRLLGSGRRRGRDRQRTLRDTIAWSHELLDADEQSLYARLAVFTDWFDLDGAAAVGGTDEFVVLDGLEGLAGKSLLVVDDGEHGRRYRYLESIRDHAWEQLEASGETEAAMTAAVDHLAGHTRALVEQLWVEDGRIEGQFRALQATLPMRPRALAWCDARDDLDRAAALFSPLAQFTTVDARLVAGAGPFVERAVEQDHPGAALLMAMHGLERMYSQDFRTYRPTLARLRTMIGDEAAPPAGVAAILAFMALIAGDLPTALEMNEAAATDLPDVRARLYEITATAERLCESGRPDREGVTDLVESTERLPSAFARATGYSVAAMAALVGDPERAGELAHRSLSLLPPGSSAWLGAYHPVPLWHVGRGELVEALDHTVTLVETGTRLGEGSALIPSLVTHALVLQRIDDAEGAATVRGALPRRWSVYAVDQQPVLDAWLSSRLSDEARARFAAKGAGLDHDALFAIAPAALAQHLAASDAKPA